MMCQSFVVVVAFFTGLFVFFREGDATRKFIIGRVSSVVSASMERKYFVAFMGE